MKYEAWVSSFVSNLTEFFNLVGRRITLEFADEQEACEDGSYVYASINVTADYQMAVITLSPHMRSDYKEGNFLQIVQSMVHEFVHVFIAPLQDQMQPHLSSTTAPLFMKIIEQQTQKLTMVFLKTLPKSLIPPRPKKNGKHNPAPKNNKSKPADDTSVSVVVRGQHR